MRQAFPHSHPAVPPIALGIRFHCRHGQDRIPCGQDSGLPRRSIIENDRRIHMSDYRKEIADDGEMLVNSTDEMIDLSMAYEPALDRFALERYKHGGYQPPVDSRMRENETIRRMKQNPTRQLQYDFERATDAKPIQR